MDKEVLEMARKELQSYQYCSQRVDSKEQQIEVLIARAEKTTTILSQLPKAKNSNFTNEETWLELIEVRKELEQLLLEDEKKKLKILRKIKKVTEIDEELGTILELKYIDNLTSGEVAKKQNYQRRNLLRKMKKALQLYLNVGGVD